MRICGQLSVWKRKLVKPSLHLLAQKVLVAEIEDGGPVAAGEIQDAGLGADLHLEPRVGGEEDAIAFGDLLDPESAVSKLSKDPRLFKLMEHLGTEPSTVYLKKQKGPGR